MWKAEGISLLWLLHRQSFTIGSLLISYLSFTCLHNGFIFCKISHVQNALCNGVEHIIDIFMMVRVLCELPLSNFCKCRNLMAYVSISIEFNDCFTNHRPWFPFYYIVCQLSRVWCNGFSLLGLLKLYMYDIC